MFVDRTKKKSKDDPIFKLVKVKGFQIYWNSHEDFVD